MAERDLVAVMELVDKRHSELRDDLREMARTHSDHFVAMTEQLKALSLSNLDMHNGLAHATERADDHSRNLAEQSALVAEIRKQQAWIKAWAAGAAAAVVATGTALLWLIQSIPAQAWEALGK